MMILRKEHWNTAGRFALLSIFFFLLYHNTYPQQGRTLEKHFAEPAHDAKPWVFWYWMNGNVSHEGIIADLKAMNDIGIGGAYLMDIGDLPHGTVRYRSAEWYDMVRTALDEASKYGIEIGFHSPGWTESGGPWITPDKAMKELAWTETCARGGQKTIRLPKSAERLGFYHDIAVVAFPSPLDDDWTTAEVMPVVTTSDGVSIKGYEAVFDGDPETFTKLPSEFVVKFAYKVKLKSVMLRADVTNGPYKADVSVWDDRTNIFVPVVSFSSNTVGPFSSNMGDVTFATVETDRVKFSLTSPTAVIEELSFSGGARTARWTAKAGFCAEDITWPNNQPEQLPPLTDDDIINGGKIIDLSDRMAPDGMLDWTVPDGNWTILRIGYIPTGVTIYPGPWGGKGLECDKMNKEATAFHYKHFITNLLGSIGPKLVKNIKYCHLDSYEAGWQNWTEGFAEEFKQRCRYDIIGWLPALTGRVIGSREQTDRFLWDFRNTIGQLFIDNHYQYLKELSHRDGFQFSNEPYGGPFNFLKLGGIADHPIVEFWMPLTPREHKIPFGGVFSGRTNGRKIISAEAFTSRDPWTAHPYALKAAGDFIYASGVNRFIIHVYAQQPFTADHLRPGMTVGGVGIQFNRNNTWWNFGGPEWVKYLTRCQSLLQQGKHVADVLYFAGDETPSDNRWFYPPLPKGYDFDACSNDIFMRLECRDGMIIIPSGKTYRYLILPQHGWLTTAMLSKTMDLLKKGATLIGDFPGPTPSLSDNILNAPKRKSLVTEMWGDIRVSEGERSVGKGRIIWGRGFQEILNADRVLPDFEYDKRTSLLLNYSHRATDNEQIYFVCNGRQTEGWVKCRFRAGEGMFPELWDASLGKIESCPVYQKYGDIYEIPIYFDKAGSTFVVFRRSGRKPPHILSMRCKNEDIFVKTKFKNSPANAKGRHSKYVDNFTVSFWVKPETTISLPTQSTDGIQWDGQNWAVFPSPGHILYGFGNSGSGISVGTNGVAVFEHWEANVPALLTYAFPKPRTDWFHVATVYKDGVPSLYIDGKFVAEGLKSGKTVHSSAFHNNAENDSFVGLLSNLKETGKKVKKLYRASGKPRNTADPEPTPLRLYTDAEENIYCEFHLRGRYSFLLSDGVSKKINIKKTAKPLKIDTGWKISFPEGWGAPKEYFANTLGSLSVNPQPEIKYFSGTATYSNTFEIDPNNISENFSVYLDLGEVSVIARITVNGQDAGTLWKPPFATDITRLIRPGLNTVEISVTNEWVNRMIGDEQFPEDVKYNGSGIAEWPSWLKNPLRRPEQRRLTFSTYRPWRKNDSLLRSGLIGPVTIKTVEKIKLTK